jgi:hypothetical protein
MKIRSKTKSKKVQLKRWNTPKLTILSETSYPDETIPTVYAQYTGTGPTGSHMIQKGPNQTKFNACN